MHIMQPGFIEALGLGRQQPHIHLHPPGSQDPAAPPVTWGLGSRAAMMTRRTPAARTAWVQGGVRPWWLQGSKVTYKSAAPGRLSGGGQGLHLGMGRPGPAVVTPAHHLAVFDHHRAHHGVGRDPGPVPRAARRKASFM